MKTWQVSSALTAVAVLGAAFGHVMEDSEKPTDHFCVAYAMENADEIEALLEDPTNKKERGWHWLNKEFSLANGAGKYGESFACAYKGYTEDGVPIAGSYHWTGEENPAP